MTSERPDLTGIPAEVIDYITTLENEIEALQRKPSAPADKPEADPDIEPQEPPTSVNILTLSKGGRLKRTFRHEYNRQRRGGMGIFDLELPAGDHPVWLAAVDEHQQMLLLTDRARAFHLPARRLPASQVRDRGASLHELIPLEPDERVVCILPNPSQGYLALLGENGYVRRLRNHIFGDYMKPGSSVLDLGSAGRLVAACLSSGEHDLLVLTRDGLGIRFAEKTVPPQGCPGIRLKDGDAPVAICGVRDSSGVFLLGSDGRGTVRQMAGFAANKAPGGGGKIAMKTDRMVGAVTVTEREDLFIISRLSKIIRFAAVEVPEKEGVVQGVNCMALRADECTAVATGS